MEKRPIPLPESRHLLPLATPPKLLITPHFLFLSDTHTQTSLGSIPSSSFSPVTTFHSPLLCLGFSHTLTDHWCVFVPGSCWATHASIHTPKQHSNVSIPVQSLCLHTHCSAEHIFTPTQWEGAEVKTTSSELRRFIFPDSLRLTGSSDL